METRPDPLIGTVIADRYRVLGPLGAGGAGQVYRALQLQLEREVALKVVHPDVPGKNRADFEARFYREASLAGRLSHPNIVHTIDYGTTAQGDPFLVMELLRGRTLRTALKGGPLDPGETARLSAEVARGLHHAHSKGMVHRDVKASNVFLTRDDEGIEHARLLDFGLVKSMRRELDITQTPTYLGTPLYMSPEQARGELDIDARSDVYALGVLMYRMLCGEMPYRAETPMGTALLHISEPYPPMRTRSKVDLAPDLESIVRRCLAKKPDDRYGDAAELARALDAWREQAASGAPSPRRSSDGLVSAAAGALGALGVLALAGGGLAVVLILVVVVVVLWPPAATEGPPLASPGAVSEVASPAPAEIAPPTPASPELTPPAVANPALVAPPAVASPPAAVPAPPKPPPPPRTSEGPRTSQAPRTSEAPRTGEAPRTTEPQPRVAEPTAGPEAPGPFEPVTLDGATFSSLSQVKRAVAFVNNASREELLAAGVHEMVVDTVLTNRPYASIQRFAYTKGIGPATMAAVERHSREDAP